RHTRSKRDWSSDVCSSDLGKRLRDVRLRMDPGRRKDDPCAAEICRFGVGGWQMKILSCGAGMQSTALALMSCENAKAGRPVHPLVPIYDAFIYCDLGFEPPWVAQKVDFFRLSFATSCLL